MKNTLISVLILIVLVLGGWFFFGGDKEDAVPVLENTEIQNEENTVASDTEFAVLSKESVLVSQEAVKEFVVSGQNFSFDPGTITVKKGDRVKITFKNSQGFHDFVIDEYSLASKKTQSPTEEVLEFTADKVGSFEYYCSVGSHRQMGMKGTLIVEE